VENAAEFLGRIRGGNRFSRFDFRIRKQFPVFLQPAISDGDVFRRWRVSRIHLRECLSQQILIGLTTGPVSTFRRVQEFSGRLLPRLNFRLRTIPIDRVSQLLNRNALTSR
jgi:hypothetical protein